MTTITPDRLENLISLNEPLERIRIEEEFTLIVNRDLNFKECEFSKKVILKCKGRSVFFESSTLNSVEFFGNFNIVSVKDSSVSDTI